MKRIKGKFNEENFKELLDSQNSWPNHYTFKFVVPKDKLEQIEEVFESDEIKTRDSSKGNYISITVTKYVISSDEIMSIYNEAAEIEGLISL
jgi:putative lipoic acid-binding regulatory protein